MKFLIGTISSVLLFLCSFAANAADIKPEHKSQCAAGQEQMYLKDGDTHHAACVTKETKNKFKDSKHVQACYAICG